jgi:hypothetical protein
MRVVVAAEYMYLPVYRGLVGMAVAALAAHLVQMGHREPQIRAGAAAVQAITLLPSVVLVAQALSFFLCLLPFIPASQLVHPR